MASFYNEHCVLMVGKSGIIENKVIFDVHIQVQVTVLECEWVEEYVSVELLNVWMNELQVNDFIMNLQASQDYFIYF